MQRITTLLEVFQFDHVTKTLLDKAVWFSNKSVFVMVAIFLNFFFIVLISNAFSADFEVEFTNKLSTYNTESWGNRHGLPKFPIISDSDLLAFNVMRIETKKVSFSEKINGEDKICIQEYFHEVSTGFLVWSSYKENSTEAVKGYYGEDREPLLVTCKHCVQEWVQEEEVKNFLFKVHYVDPIKKQFHLLTIDIKNISDKKVPWILGERDMAVLRLGTILQRGKVALDAKLNSSHYPLFQAIDVKNFNDRIDFGYLSDIVMFGYPYELSASNSLPLARFGHCSTDPKQSIYADPEGGGADFYVDMASISGSSGSPVWFFLKKIKGEVDDTEVEVNAYLDNAEVNGEQGDLRLSDTKVSVMSAELKRGEVQIEEEIKTVFAGMLFGGPELSDGVTQDIHLGEVLNAQNVFNFLGSIKAT